MNKWLALALAFTSHRCSSVPYWESEFEGLFIFTPRWCVRIQQHGVIHRWRHGAAATNRILMWCARDRAEIGKEIKAAEWVRIWDTVYCYWTSTEKHGDWNDTPLHTHPPRLTPALHALSKSTNTFPRGSTFQDALLPEGRMIKQIRHPPSRFRNNK